MKHEKCKCNERGGGLIGGRIIIKRKKKTKNIRDIGKSRRAFIFSGSENVPQVI